MTQKMEKHCQGFIAGPKNAQEGEIDLNDEENINLSGEEDYLFDDFKSMKKWLITFGYRGSYILIFKAANAILAVTA